MKRIFTETFDELIQNYYGPTGCREVPSNTARLEELFASYYGKATGSRDEQRRKPAVTVLSLSFDDGETLPQSSPEQQFEEYVVQQSHTHAPFDEYVVHDDAPLEEYVVHDESLARSSSVAAWDEVAPTETISAVQEYGVDILQPLNERETLNSRAAAPADTAAAAPLSPIREDSQQRPDGSGQISPAAAEMSQPQAADDDFAADMQAILTGQSVYDPVSKKTLAKDEINRPPTAGSTNGGSPPTRDANNSQAIFDRIAQSMEYANAYDLGTVELTNRFADFDRLAELQEKSQEDKKAKKRQASAGGPSPVAPADSEDFIRDLDAIRNRPGVAEYMQGQELQSAQSTASADNTLSAARQKVINEYWPLVKGGKYKGAKDGEEKRKWDLLLPGVNIEEARRTYPGYTTCGVLPLFLLKKLGGIEDPGIMSGGVSGVRDGVDLNQHTSDLNYARRMFGPYAWLDAKGNIFKGGAKNLGVWIPNDGTIRPKPGDIYLLEGNISKAGQPPMIGVRHIGVIVSAPKGDGTHPETWLTADAGQGVGDDQQCVEQSRTYDPADRTVTGTADKGTVVGWVDLDLLVQKSAAMKAAAGTPAAEDIYSS